MGETLSPETQKYYVGWYDIIGLKWLELAGVRKLKIVVLLEEKKIRFSFQTQKNYVFFVFYCYIWAPCDHGCGLKGSKRHVSF